MNLTAEIYRAQLNQPLHWSWMLRGRFKTEQIFLMHILSLWKAAYDAWEWFRDYPRLQFHKVKLHVALSRFSWRNRKRMHTFHGAASFLGLSVHAPKNHRPDDGNCLEERETACCPNDRNDFGPPVFYFLFNGGSERICASGLARAVRRIFFSSSASSPILAGRGAATWGRWQRH